MQGCDKTNETKQTPKKFRYKQSLFTARRKLLKDLEWTNCTKTKTSVCFFFLFFFHKRGPLWSTVSDFFSLTLLKDWMELRRAPLPAPLPPGGERGRGTGSFPGGGGGGGAAGGGRGGGWRVLLRESEENSPVTIS